MYIIGNAETAKSVPMWSNIIALLEEDENMGETLQLCCPRHPDTVIEVKDADDFVRLSPEGGCSESCDQRLSCGHRCISKCHAQVMHDNTMCLEPCQRSVKGCNAHPCPNPCGSECVSRCEVKISEVELPCGHVQDVPCYIANNLELARCKVLVQFTNPGCEHTTTVNCYETKSLSTSSCRATCGALLQCGRLCADPCRNCHMLQKDGTIVISHDQCQQVCGRNYTVCKHACTSTCHGEKPCPPCEAACDEVCAHSGKQS